MKFSVWIFISLRKVLNYFAEKSEQKNIFTFFVYYIFSKFTCKSAPNHFSKLLISSLYFEAKFAFAQYHLQSRKTFWTIEIWSKNKQMAA